MEKGVDRETLIKDILEKRELSNLDPEFAREKLDTFLTKRQDLVKKLSTISTRSGEYKKIVKEMRSQLRKIYGVFISRKFSNKKELLEELKQDPSIENHIAILKLHKSSSERLEIYEDVYERIFEVTGKPKKILDLACGLNPLSYPFLGCKPQYIAADLSKEDMDFVQSYFDVMKIKGKAVVLDLVKATPDQLNELSKSMDVTFLFKTLDSLETVEWNSSKRVIDSLKSKWIVISFATRSIGGGKEIKKERRQWVEKYLAQKNLSYTEIELEGEIFYVVRN